jgi:hypothetical protein
MAGFSVQTTISNDDWDALLHALAMRSAAENGRQRLVANVVCSVGLALAAYVFFGANIALHVPEVVGGIAIGLVSIAVRAYIAQRRVNPNPNGLMLGTVTIQIAADGIHHRRTHSTSVTEWELLQDVTYTYSHIFLWFDRIAAYVIPVRDLPPVITVDLAVAEIRRLALAASRTRMAAQLGDAPPLQSVPSSIPDASPVGSLPSSLAASLRLLLFRKLDSPDSVVHDGATFALVVLSIGLWSILDFESQGPNPEWYPSGLTGIAWYLLAGLVIAWIVARRSIPTLRLRTPLWIISTISPVLIAGLWFAEHHATRVLCWAVVALTYLLCVLYAARALRNLTGRRQTAAIALAILTAFLINWGTSKIYVSPSVWTERSEPDFQPRWNQIEQLLVGQSDRIDSAVTHLAGSQGPAASAYMVGFAGVGGQKVFAEEIGLAAEVIGNRFGTKDHTVLLVNDQRNLETLPLATVSGLKRALRDIGNRMNHDTDVLFLAISSHGGADPVISVSNGALPLNQLTGADLSAALKESGIRWKVIVISACHAGAFIPALKDDDTIILTAAAATRTSFGCSNDRDLTYFGEAFYRDALPKAATLQEAFDQASAAIAAREQAEKITPSQPQAFYGTAIAAQFPQLKLVSPSHSEKAREP